MTESTRSQSTPYDPFEVGQSVGGQFKIEKILGHNEIGTVYRARKTDNDRRMVLKSLPGDTLSDEDYERLRESIRKVSGLKHKNLARVYGLGREGAAIFVVMEYLDGQSLAAYLKKRRSRGEALSPKGVFNVIGHVCSALKALHETDCHGALTPRHVFVTREGRVKVSNLAYGRFLAEALERQGMGPFVDSPFVAPEVRVDAGMASAASDLYSLGMLTGELLAPEPLKGVEESAKISALSSVASYEIDIQRLIEAATATDPKSRIKDASEFRTRLKAIVDATKEVSKPEPEPEPVAEPPSGQSVEIGPGPGEEALPDDAPTPNPKDTVDPFEKAAMLLGQSGTFAAPADDDDAGQSRYLVSRDGLDYGPYTYEQVLDQLHTDLIDEFTSVLDRQTQTRRHLQDFDVFRFAVAEYLPLREERRRLELERRSQMVETAKTAGRWTSYMGVVAALLIGGAMAFYWFVLRPEPQALPEQMLLADLSSAYKMLPPPKDFGQINVDKDLMAALWGGGGGGKKGARRGGKGVRRGGKGARGGRGGGAGKGGGDDDLNNFADFNSEGGSTHVLTDAEVTKVVLSNFGGLQGCLMPEIKRNPSFRGVRVKFFIKQSGTTAGVNIVEGAYKSGPVASCLKSRFRNMRFPAHGGFNKGVIFPLLIK